MPGSGGGRVSVAVLQDEIASYWFLRDKAASGDNRDSVASASVGFAFPIRMCYRTSVSVYVVYEPSRFCFRLPAIMAFSYLSLSQN